jgi:hypothetical protein
MGTKNAGLEPAVGERGADRIVTGITPPSNRAHRR